MCVFLFEQKRFCLAVHLVLLFFQYELKMKKKNLKYWVGFLDFRAEVVQQLQSTNQRPSSPISRPGSSDGSTTVSATSSPGIDQQEQEELNAFYRQVIQSLIDEKHHAHCVCIVETKETF